MRPLSQTRDQIALASFVGWLPLLVVNALVIVTLRLRLDLRPRALHYLYDAGQLLGLAALSWLLVRLLWPLPLRFRAALGWGLAFAASYGLLGGDLDGFIERHARSQVPWRALLSLAGSLAVTASVALGLLLSRGTLRWLGVMLGIGLAVANHRILELDYRGIHLLLAWCAANLMGMSAVAWLAPLAARRPVGVGLAVLGLAGLLGYLLVPGPVVRSALLRSSGAIAAPFVAQGWTYLGREDQKTRMAKRSQWWKPRRGLPAVAPDVLPGSPAAPIVVLLTPDGVRGDVLGGRGAPKVAPSLHAMAKSSLSFSRAWSPAAATQPSMRSFFLGTYYSQLRSGRGRPKGPHLASLLTSGGVHTVHLRTHNSLAPGRGIAEGFGQEQVMGKLAHADVIVDAVLATLEAHPRGPLFIFSHMLDTHAPYDRGAKRGSQKRRYLSEVSVVDAEIGRLRRELKRRGMDAITYLIVSSDHGEAFGEHGRRFHATTIYEEMIRVPLLIEGPGVVPRRMDQWVSLMDVGPTILSLFGLPTPAHYMGQSLVPLMRGDSTSLSRPLVVDGQRRKQAMLFDERYKAIVDLRSGTEELYDLRSDPGEQRNLAEGADAHRYFAELRAFFSALSPEPP